MNTDNIMQHIDSKTCSRCGGPAPHWKCPKCKTESENFDPNHWRNCQQQTKMQAKCEACNEAEMNCTCEPQS